MALPVGLEPCSLIDHSCSSCCPWSLRGRTPQSPEDSWLHHVLWEQGRLASGGVGWRHCPACPEGRDRAVAVVMTTALQSASLSHLWTGCCYPILQQRKQAQVRGHAPSPTVRCTAGTQTLVSRLQAQHCLHYPTAARAPPPVPGTGSVIHIELVWLGFLAITYLHQQASFKRKIGSSCCFLEGENGGRSHQHWAPKSPVSTHTETRTPLGRAQWAGGDALLRCPDSSSSGEEALGVRGALSLGSASSPNWGSQGHGEWNKLGFYSLWSVRP